MGRHADKDIIGRRELGEEGGRIDGSAAVTRLKPWRSLKCLLTSIYDEDVLGGWVTGKLGSRKLTFALRILQLEITDNGEE